MWISVFESGVNVTNPTGDLVASSDAASAPSVAFQSCVKWSVPPTPSHRPSGLAATENAGHRFVGATSSPLSVSHTRRLGAPELANRSGEPAMTAIACRPFGFGPASSFPSRTSHT